MIKCDYCGRENADGSAACPGCGTPPAQSRDEAQGDVASAVSVSGFAGCAVGLAGIALGHVGGVMHLVKGLFDLSSPSEENSPYRLLEYAAALESLDMRQAIALYDHIGLNYPGTSEAEEARRNVQTLRAAHPELEDFDVASPNI